MNKDFFIKISSGFKALLTNETEETVPTGFWERAKKLLTDKPSSTITKQSKKNRQRISKETLEGVEKREEMKTKGVNNQVEVENYKRQSVIILQQMMKDKENHITDQCQRTEESTIIKFKATIKFFVKVKK